MSQVIVMPPGGRRQTIKVTPNTTILEIIEQSCAKAGFKAEEYDLKHHRSILDATSTIRFAGLPQNAQLELVEAKQKRVESVVTLCLQFEAGQRVQAECNPCDTLWECLLKISPESAASMESPVIVYMRREVIGKEELMKTSLRALGVTGGRVAMRVINRTPAELREQANVSAPLRPKQVEPTAQEEPVAPSSTPMEVTVGEAVLPPAVPTSAPQTAKLEADPTTELDVSASQTAELEKQKDVSAPLQLDTSTTVEAENRDISPNNLVASKRARLESPKKEEIFEKVILLGERNAVAFNLDTVPPSTVDELPDDFYELTLSDVKMLAKAANRRLMELENAPLQTAAQRKLQEDMHVLRKLSQHKSCVIRVRFPDRTVLQGCFKPIETVADVHDFVMEYLDDPSLPFHLYVTPPKQVLETEKRLLEVDCVPSAILYFGLKESIQAPSTYLKKEVLGKFSTLAAASQQCNRHLKENERHPQLLDVDKAQSSAANSIASAAIPGTSKDTSTSAASASASASFQPPMTSKGPRTEKKDIPKWFKVSK